MIRALAPLLALVALSACGLQPLYSGGSTGTVAQGLTDIDIGPIEGKAGWLMTNAIRDRLTSGTRAGGRYRLEIRLSDSIEGFGIRKDDSVTRERRWLRARYRLVDTSTGAQLLDATAGSDAGIDVVGSEYAVIAAEDRALENMTDQVADQIVSRLALLARKGKLQ